jgi:hypothetical protein
MPNNTTAINPTHPDFASSDIGCFAEHKFSLLEQCVFPQLAGATAGSGALFGLLFSTVLLGSVWYATDQSTGAVAGILILFGGALMNMLPGSYRSMAWSIIFIGIAGVFLAIGQRYVLDPTTQRGL